MGTDESTLAEQIRYYSARAAEYDEWWDRRGRYDRGPQTNARWRAEREVLTRTLDELDVRGDVVELACGTGIWTERLVRAAASVTAVDASPETLDVNRARLGTASERVNYLRTDLFAWEPERTFHAVVFGFWLSHVPRERLGPFIAMVASALRPGGSVFFADSKREPSSTASDHALPSGPEEVTTRRLNDGSAYRLVKIFWSRSELEPAFASAGIDVTIHETPAYFIYGIGQRKHRPRSHTRDWGLEDVNL